ncbi:unnamed protein product, partial [Meganyctiphanes norvegica]
MASSRRNSSRKRTYEEYTEELNGSSNKKDPGNNFQQSSFHTNQHPQVQGNYLSSITTKTKADVVVNQHTDNMGKPGMTLQLLSNLQNLEREHREKVKIKQQLQTSIPQEAYLHNNIQHKMNFEGGRTFKHQKVDLRTEVSDLYLNIPLRKYQKQMDQMPHYQNHRPVQDQGIVRKQNFSNFSEHKNQEIPSQQLLNEEMREKSMAIKHTQNNSNIVKCEKPPLIPLQQVNEGSKLSSKLPTCDKQEQSHLPKYRKQTRQSTRLIIDETKKSEQLDSLKGPVYVHPKKMYLDHTAKSNKKIPSAGTSYSSSINDADTHKIPTMEPPSKRISSSDSFHEMPHSSDMSPTVDGYVPTTFSTAPLPDLISTAAVPTTPTTPDYLPSLPSFDRVSSNPGYDAYLDNMTLSYVYKSQYDALKSAREPDDSIYRHYSNTSSEALRRSSVISNTSSEPMRRSSVISYCSDNQSENSAPSLMSPVSNQERPSLSGSDQQSEFYETNVENNQIENQNNRTKKLPSISTFNLPWKCPDQFENSIQQDIFNNRNYDTMNSEAFFHKAHPHSNPYISNRTDKAYMTNKCYSTNASSNPMKSRVIKIKREPETDDDVFREPTTRSVQNSSPHRYRHQQTEPVYVHSFLTHTDEATQMDSYKRNTEDDALTENKSHFLDYIYHRVNEDNNLALNKDTMAVATQNTDMQPDYCDISKKCMGQFDISPSKTQNIPLNLSVHNNVTKPVSSIVTSFPNTNYQNIHSIYNKKKAESLQTLTPKTVENFIYKPHTKNKQVKSLKDQSLYCYTCNKTGVLVPPRKKFLHLYFGPHTCQDCNALLLCDVFFFPPNQIGTCKHKRRTPFKFPYQFLSSYLPCEEGSSEVFTVGRYLQKLIFLCFRQPWIESFDKSIATMNSLVNKDIDDYEKTFYGDSLNNDDNTDEEYSKRHLMKNTENSATYISISNYKKYFHDNNMFHGDDIDNMHSVNIPKKTAQLLLSERDDNVLYKSSKTKKIKKKKFHIYETLKAKKAMALKHFDEIAFLLQKQTYIHKDSSVRESIIPSNHNMKHV